MFRTRSRTKELLQLGTRRDDTNPTSSPAPPLPSEPPSPVATPVYAQFATASNLPQPPLSPKPIKVAAIPRAVRPSPLEPPPPSTPAASAPIPPAAASTGAAMPAEPDDGPLEDGPLFRAHLSALEKRSASLRTALKKLQRAVEASLSALQANAAAQATVDEALEELSAGSATSNSEVLGGLFDRELRSVRDGARGRAAREMERGREMSELMKGAIDRIKLVEEKRKAFEADSKKYYDELAKYLGRGESDAAKVASLDLKQADRAASFRQQRLDYFSFLEGLVESEERAVASWLRTWADAGGSEDAAQQDRAQARMASLAALEGRTPPKLSAGSSSNGWIHVQGSPDPDSIAVGEATLIDDPSSAAPSTSPNLAHGDPPFSPLPLSSADDKAQRRRRSSIPHFHLAEHKEREREVSGGARDRLKGFLKNASYSIQAALPTSASSPTLIPDAFQRRPSPPPPIPQHSPPLFSPGPSPSNPIQPLPHPAQSLAPPPTRPPLHSAASHMRRKEGFLYATDAPQKHTASGSGGGVWNRYWVTLAEGQLVEYDKWQDAMSVHGTPINLRYATARVSKNSGERRFCFEVLTPTLRRVFQASSEKEMQEWVTAISKSVESLLNGTSSVRHFDASRLTGNPMPYSLNEFGSTTSLSLIRPTPSPSSSAEPPTSPKSRLPDFLARRASMGHGRKISLSKKDKRRSHQTPPIPSLTIGEELVGKDGTPIDRAYFDSARRRGLFAFSEGTEAPPLPPGAGRPSLNGLGIPFPSLTGASKSSPDLLAPSVPIGQRSTSSPFPGGGGSSECSVDDAHSDRAVADDDASELSAQDRAISDAVRGWASDDGGGGSTTRSFPSAADAEEAKYRNAARIVEIAERGGEEWQNDRCADCREQSPRWASWSLGITLCIRCSGVHRSLGTHVSKVRSVELDDWSDEQLAHMEAVGNARSNAFFEARMPAGTVEQLSDSSVAAHIRQKYVEKRWIADGASLPSSASSAHPPPSSLST
ncbi:hypothetical protein JCM10213_001977 [Rhodosporidiobolus nylandii]